jgi:hypothetical protein
MEARSEGANRTPNVFFSTHVAEEQQPLTTQAFRFIAAQYEFSFQET